MKTKAIGEDWNIMSFYFQFNKHRIQLQLIIVCSCVQKIWSNKENKFSLEKLSWTFFDTSTKYYYCEDT